MKDYDIEMILNAIKGSGGFYTKIANSLKCSWATAVKYVNLYEETKQAYSEELEIVLDMAESKLLENVQDNDNAAIQFYLKSKGKNRGYGESRELNITQKTEMIIELEEDEDEEEKTE